MVNSGFGTYQRGGSLDVLGPWDAHGGSAVTCIAWSPGGRRITSCASDEAMLKIWDLGRCITWSFEGEHEKRGVKKTAWLCAAYCHDGSGCGTCMMHLPVAHREVSGMRKTGAQRFGATRTACSLS